MSIKKLFFVFLFLKVYYYYYYYYYYYPLTHKWGGVCGGAVGLRHCTTSRKVAVSIRDGVIKISH